MKHRSLSVIILALVFLIASLAVVGGAASAAVAQADVPPAEPTVTQAVWTTADSGQGSLRQAINDAVSGDAIYFAGNLSGQTIVLSSTLVITKNLTIDAQGLALPVTIDGNSAVRLFKVSNNARLTLAGLTLARGRDTSTECSAQSCGGAFKVEAGSIMTLSHSTVFSSTAYAGGGGYIAAAGVLNVEASTFYSNTAGQNGGGLMNYGTLAVLNSTLSGNSAPNGGGLNNAGALTLRNDTLTNNVGNASSGGGLRDTGTLSYTNTIMANSSGGDCLKVSGTIVTSTNNLVEDGGCSAGAVNFLSGDPALGLLADNGGGTLTHALLPGSRAIDAGNNATCPAIDQRGVTRPQNAACDIGAVEAPAQAILRLTKSVTPTTSVPYHGVVTYTVVLSNSGDASDAAVWLTDTLPAQVDFAAWVVNPGASVSNDEITWSGALNSQQAITFTWTATHTGAYNDSVVNTAQASDASFARSASATFTVTCATSMTVLNTLDSGAGSLRQAVIEVCAGGLVDFAPGLAGQTIGLASTVSINKNVTVDGRSLATPVTVDGNNAVRLFRVTTNISATFAGLTLAHGKGQPAGALLVDTGAVVTLTRATVLSNTSTSDGGGIYNYGGLNVQGSTFTGNSSSIDGGGVYNVGRLNLQDSTFAGNTANDDGGGLYNRGPLNAQSNTFTRNRSNDDGGGFYNDGAGPAVVTNTTFSANTSGYWGGGLCTNSSSVLTLTNSTLTGNAASVAGGGVRNLGRLSMRNTIIANSTVGVDCVNVGTLASNLNNLVKDGTCSAMLSGDPVLGPLADNGGGTLTHALWPNSPAIDAGSDASDICPATDQRGAARPQNLHCDIGAVEAPVRLPLITKSVTPNSNVPYHSVVTYTLLLSNRGTEADPDVWVTDTLPAQVDFGSWVQNPGASVAGDQITWHGAVGTAEVFVFVFTATHTGAAFNEAVLNTAQVSGTQLASDATATFVVSCTNHLTVQTTQDDGAGSLRQALREICAGGLIDFAPGLAGQTIVLASPLGLNKNVTIDGLGLATPVTLSGNDAVRIFKVTNSTRVTLAGLTLARGKDTSLECSDGVVARSCGGALKVDAGAIVTVTHSTVQTNTAYFGGGISNFGTLLIQASTIVGNVGGWDGGGLYNKGTVTVQNSTVSGNTGNYGGGICGVDGVTILQNSTLVGNTANGGGGGGLRQYGGTLHYSNTLMADNLTGGDCYVNASNVISTNVNNLVRNGAICNAALSGDPVLSPLADNGGRTLTHALMAGSAAIDMGGDSCPATDQRGVARPIGPHCDIGAVEGQPETAVSKFVTPINDVPYHGPVTYTVRLANAGPLTDTAVVFSDTLPAQVIFGQWVEKPAAATLVNGNRLTWNGILTPGNVITVSWTALHIGDYGDIVVNTAAISGTTRTDMATATFMVEDKKKVYLPLVLR